VTRPRFYGVDLFPLDLANKLTRLNAARRNCQIETQQFDLSITLAAAAKCTALTVRLQNESLVALRSDNNFLYVRHDVVLQSALTENKQISEPIFGLDFGPRDKS